MVEKVLRCRLSRLDTIPAVTDEQTDGHAAMAKTALCRASRG